MSSITIRRAQTRLRTLSVEVCEGRVLLSGLARVAHHLTAGFVDLNVERSHLVERHAPDAKARLNGAASAARTFAHPFLERLPTPISPLGGKGGSGKGGGGGTGSPPSTALTPAEVRNIYGFNQISNLGAGQTIAIVDAYDDPSIFNDANVFDQQFPTTIGGNTTYYSAYGDSSTWLTKVYASGTQPSGNVGWGQEISLDVEWAHAIAPLAHIDLVEAASNSFANLLAADSKAVALGAVVISNSWGGGEFSGETGYDSTFNVPGVTFVFSAGDSGNQSYPAESPYVVSVGGTTLSHDSSYNWTGESGWSSGGGGVSAYEPKPPYQSALTYGNRAGPDVAYNADPNSGVAVYDSYGAKRTSPAWGQYGGTSAGSPQWSALLAIADQGRVAAGKSILDGYTQTLPALYTMTSDSNGTDLYDVTSGSNSVGTAGIGFDLVTGNGTPRKAYNTYAYFVNTVA